MKDGAIYRLRRWPDDGEAFVADGYVLRNLTYPRIDGVNDLFVLESGELVNHRGQHVGWPDDLEEDA